MTNTERQKAHHLNLCRLWPESFDNRFVRGMAWMAEHNKAKPLTNRQKFCLDLLIYRYRAQLASRLQQELMIDTQPNPDDYGVQETNEKEGMVNDLFNGKPGKPHKSKKHEMDSPQHSLF